MSKIREQTYQALNAHVEATILRVVHDASTGAVEFWIGKRKNRDYPRLAKIGPKDADALIAWLAQVRRVGGASVSKAEH